MGETIPEQQSLSPSGATPLYGTSILLAEDSPLVQEISRMLLERAGATVTVAHNGREVLDLVHIEHFDCILMDIQMPVMDGLEATRLLRTDPSCADLKIIAISADSQPEEREACRAAGMNDFIAKPFSAWQLFTTLAKWLPQYAPGEAEAGAAGDITHGDSRCKTWGAA